MDQRRKTQSAVACVLAMVKLCSGMMLGGCSTARGPHEVPAALQTLRITVQPKERTVPAGHHASFSVTATGREPLSYEWRRNGLTLHASNSASYTTPALFVKDNGTRYSVVVSNDLGAVLSTPARLTVEPTGR